MPEKTRVLKKQAIFNRVKKHLLSQRVRCSTDQFTGCKYRLEVGDRTLKCAIGALIKDRYYNKVFEGVAVTPNPEATVGVLGSKQVRLMEALRLSGVHLGGDELMLMKSLQRIHDEVEVFNWENKLRGVAIFFGLKYDYEKNKG